jgi:serine/threonine-protein kinase HipA
VKRLNVHYHGLKVGQLAEAREGVFFEYDPGFLASGHDLSPLYLKPVRGVLSRDSAPSPRLPGLFEDSLPDRWGRRLMVEFFRRQGTSEHAITPLLMLAYVGGHGMGALTYQPDLEVPVTTDALSLQALHTAAEQAERSGTIDLNVLAEVGSPVGGARPKALLGLPRDGGNEVLAGAGDLPATHEAWIVKFDISGDGTHGVMEEAFARMARAAGIELPESRLLETTHAGGARRHFAVKRFDRFGVERIHHHTLAAMCHMGGGDLNYETLLRVTRLITKDEREVLRAYRRAVFNVLAGNRDDHGKNHGFIYTNREWKLGPAYDLTFTSAQQLPERGLSIAGERRAAGAVHLVKLADSEGLDRASARAIVDEVAGAIARWREFADQAGLPGIAAAEIGSALRM